MYQIERSPIEMKQNKSRNVFRSTDRQCERAQEDLHEFDGLASIDRGTGAETIIARQRVGLNFNSDTGSRHFVQVADHLGLKALRLEPLAQQRVTNAWGSVLHLQVNTNF